MITRKLGTMLSVRLAKDPTQEWASSSTAQLGQEDARLSITIPSFVLDLLAGLSPENLKVDENLGQNYVFKVYDFVFHCQNPYPPSILYISECANNEIIGKQISPTWSIKKKK